MTRANELYIQAIRDEVAATEFLRRYELLEQPVDIAPCSKCEGEIAEKRRKIKGEIQFQFNFNLFQRFITLYKFNKHMSHLLI